MRERKKVQEERDREREGQWSERNREESGRGKKTFLGSHDLKVDKVQD